MRCSAGFICLRRLRTAIASDKPASWRILGLQVPPRPRLRLGRHWPPALAAYRAVLTPYKCSVGAARSGSAVRSSRGTCRQATAWDTALSRCSPAARAVRRAQVPPRARRKQAEPEAARRRFVETMRVQLWPSWPKTPRSFAAPCAEHLAEPAGPHSSADLPTERKPAVPAAVCKVVPRGRTCSAGGERKRSVAAGLRWASGSAIAADTPRHPDRGAGSYRPSP